MTKKQKMNAQLWLGVFLAISGVVLIFLSFVVPPLGLIHASVLAAIGELFTFSGALIGVDYSYKFKRDKLERTMRTEEDNEEQDT